MFEFRACPHDWTGGYELAKYGAERRNHIPVPSSCGECSGEFRIYEHQCGYYSGVSASGPDEPGGFDGFDVPDQLDMDAELDERDGL